MNTQINEHHSVNTPRINATTTNRCGTRQLATMSLLCAIGVILSFIEFPLLPGVPWLKYDTSAMTAMVAGFAFGPAAGISVGVVGALIHGLIMGDFFGALVNMVVVTAFVLPAAILYRKNRTFKQGALGLVISVIVATITALLANLVVTPLYLGVPLEAVLDLILPVLTPFNLIKHSLNAVLTLVVYKSISNLITPTKKQVKGR